MLNLSSRPAGLFSAAAFSLSCLAILLVLAALATPAWADKDSGRPQSGGGAGGSGSGPQAITMALSNGKTAIQELRAGGDLYVSASGFGPHEMVEVALIDDLGNVVSLAQALSDDTGQVDSFPLWWRTGVVGCGPEAGADPLKYRFARVDDALSWLGGRTFDVLVSSSVGAAGGALPLPMGLEIESPFYQFTDGSGCGAANLYEGDTLYLSGSNLGASIGTLTVFLVSVSAPPEVGDSLADVRGPAPLYPQQITIPTDETSFEVPIWVDTVAGVYGAVIRKGTSTTAVFQAGDRWLGFEGSGSTRGPHGITIKTHQCPDCDDL